MQTVKLTYEQGLPIAELPKDYRVIGVDRRAPLVREPTGQRIKQNGRLTAATTEAKLRLAERRNDQAGHRGGVRMTAPYTSVME